MVNYAEIIRELDKEISRLNGARTTLLELRDGTPVRRLGRPPKQRESTSKPRHRMSEAGKANLRAFAKKRWAELRKAGKNRLESAKK